MPSNNEKKPFSKSYVYVSLGAFLALAGVMVLLCLSTHIAYLAYPIYFLLGTAGFYIVSLGLFVGGFHLMFHKVWKKYPTRLNLGLLFLLLGIYALICAFSLTPSSVSPEAFPDALNEAFLAKGFGLYEFGPLSGGIFGAVTFLALAKANLSFVSFLIAAALLLLGILLTLLPVWKKAYRGVRASIAVNHAKKTALKERQQAEEEGSFVIESEEPYPMSRDPFGLGVNEPRQVSSSAPELGFSAQSKEEEPLPKAPESPLSSYVFAPAGGSTLPSRKAMRAQKAFTSKESIEGDPTPAMPSTSPREVSSPSPSSYSQNPVRQAGLQEAFFVPSGEPRPERPSFKQEAPQEEPKQVAPSPVPAEPAPVFPASPRIAVDAEPRPEPQEEAVEEPAPSYAPKIDALPVQSEPSYEKQVDTSSLLHEVKPADTITLADSEEEEEAYEPPKNDPIVLTPDPTVILTPETVNPIPEPEVKEEASQSNDPIPDYDPPKAPETHNFEDENEGPLPRYVFPDASLLDEGKGESDKEAILAECAEKARLIDQIFADFGVGAHVTEYLVGPSITRYSIAADPGVSVSTISRYIQDLEVRLGGVPVRFVERVLGLACSALEVANTTRRIVPFKEVFVGLPKRKDSADLHIPFGIDIAGTLKEADLGKFPHMLVAGTSGSGKSIFAHGILMSLVMRNRPEDLKLVLIDPKRGVEMAPYKDMPHLLCPIVKEAHPAKNALKKLCDVMDERYEVFARTEVRDIGSYNRDYAIPNGKKRMPYIVVFVDEFADLVGECKEISEYVLRIAQKARACGIHLIVATQRPDVKVITGTIKSNLLCRVALTVASSTDSQTILGVGGAEDLYGYGDMLIDCQELSKRDFVRAQGCLATTHEMKAVCDFVRAQMKPHYDPNFLNLEDEEEESGPEIRDGGYAPAAPSVSSQELRKMADEEKYQYVKSVIMTREYCSISMIQREFEVGFPRAGKILARLQNEGVVAAAETSNNSRGCRVLIHEDPSGDGGIA